MKKLIMQKYTGPDGITDEIVFEIDTINKCNFNCEYCGMQNNIWNPNSNRGDWGKTQSILKLLPFFEKFPYPFKIHLLGGEPTLHPDLIKFISGIKTSDTRKIKLFTNGSNFNKVQKISLLNEKHIDLMVSIHLAEFTDAHLNRYLETDLDGFKNIKFLIIMIDLVKYKNRIIEIITKLKDKFEVEWVPAFNENGEYKLNEEELEIWKEIDEKFLVNRLNLGLKKSSHREIYLSRKKISQKKLCYKNLWIINYLSVFTLDGTDKTCTLEEAEKDYTIFKHTPMVCVAECWLSPNNYYTKIREYNGK